MVNQIERKVRSAEREIDTAYKNLDLLRGGFANSTWHALTYFEDALRLPTHGILSIEDFGECKACLQHYQYALDYVLRWCYECCPKKHHFSSDSISWKYYKSAREAFEMALNYSIIVDAFTLYSRGRYSAKIDNRTIRFLPKRNDVFSYAAYDRTGDVVKEQESLQSILPHLSSEELKTQFLSSIRSVGKYAISYAFNEELFTEFARTLAEYETRLYEVPEDWDFGNYTIEEFRLLYQALITLSVIHDLACSNSHLADVKGLAPASAVLVKTRNEWIDFFRQHTSLAEEKIDALLHDLTFDPLIKNGDIIFQPFVLLNSEYLAIAPHLILTS